MSFNEGSSDSNQNALTSQFSRQFGTGGTTATPTNAQQIIDALNGAQQFYTNTLPGQSTIGYGAQLVANNVGAADAIVGAGVNPLLQTAQGAYLNSNPYLDQTYQRAAGQLEQANRSAWGGSDAIPGSSGVQQAALANAQAGLANQLYGQNYTQERQNQLAAIQSLPSYASGLIAPNQAVISAGQAQQSSAMAPWQQYLAALGAVSPGSTTSTTKDVTQVGSGTTAGTSQGNTSSKGLNLF